ncbi:MAG: hypothetical protein ABSB19_09530 [Methylomonas sp.]|jgi:hypothetical protein
MIIIIKKDPPAVLNANEVEKLLHPFIKGRFWEKSGELKSLRIIEIAGPRNTFYEYHCICEVFPVEVSRRVIKNLNGKILFGAPLAVQEYMVRNPFNDQRKQGAANSRTAQEKRKSERRRTPLVSRQLDGK